MMRVSLIPESIFPLGDDFIYKAADDRGIVLRHSVLL